MCVPEKLGNVVEPKLRELAVASQGYPYPQSLALILPTWTHEGQDFNLNAVATLTNGVLSVTLYQEPSEGNRIVGAFQIAFEVWEGKLEMAMANPKKLAIFDDTGHWVPELVLPNFISIAVFPLDKRFNANWASNSPLVGLVFTGGHCHLAPWRVTIWRWLAYWDMTRGVS